MNYLLLDGNSILHAAQHSKPLSCNGIPTHGIIGFLKTLRVTIETNSAFEHIFILWDRKAHWRYEIYPGYKGNREKTDDQVTAKKEIVAQKPYLAASIFHLGIPQVTANNYEADDLAGYFSRKLVAEGHRVRLVSGDQDWIQLVNSNVSWVDHRSGATKKCNRTNFEEFTGYKNGRQFLMGKVLCGDTSDMVTGVGGIGAGTAPALVAHFGDITEVFRGYAANGPYTKAMLPESLHRACSKINLLCESGKPIFSRNFKLMNLLSGGKDEDIAGHLRITNGKFNWESFEDICMELDFNSILATKASWQRLFGERKNG